MLKYAAIILFLASVTTAQNNSLLSNNISPKNISIFPQETDYSYEKKSVPLAVCYSLLVPGMGELYAGDYSIGKYNTVVEGLLWLTLIGFDRYGTWIQNDARNYAVQHAGVISAGKNDRFFVDIGNYNNVSDYNDEMLRERNPYRLYNSSSSYSWEWDSRANREYYRDLRIQSDNMFNSTHFVAAAIVINHVISAVNAARMVLSKNSELVRTDSFDIHASVMGDPWRPHGLMISFTKSF